MANLDRDRYLRLELAARALLDAFGGDVPDWLRPQAIALSKALDDENVSDLSPA